MQRIMVTRGAGFIGSNFARMMLDKHPDYQVLDQARLDPQVDFDGAFQQTVEWYVNNRHWWEKIKSGDFAEYYARMYGQREVLSKHE